jgi:hypothetical protein
MSKLLRSIFKLIFRSVTTFAITCFGLLGASTLLTALGAIPVDLGPVPRILVGATGLCFVLFSLLLLFRQAASEWGQDNPLYRWTALSLEVAGLLVFCSIFIWVGMDSFFSRQAVGDSATDSLPVLGLEHWEFDALLFGGLGLIFLLATLVRTDWRVRALLAKAPDSQTDGAGGA